MHINKIEITAKKFAYDGCHKIYLLENEAEEAEALENRYTIYPIELVKETYKDSCSLRFISSWNMKEYKVYVGQCERAYFRK